MRLHLDTGTGLSGCRSGTAGRAALEATGECRGLTDHVVQVVDDDLGVVGGVHGAAQERRPRAQLRFLDQRTCYEVVALVAFRL